MKWDVFSFRGQFYILSQTCTHNKPHANTESSEEHEDMAAKPAWQNTWSLTAECVHTEDNRTNSVTSKRHTSSHAFIPGAH